MTWALIVLYAASIGVDGWVSQQSDFHEQNPIARPFSHSAKGQAFGCALGFAAGVVPSYILKRSHHPKAAKIWLGIFTAPEAVNAGHQLYEYETFTHRPNQ
jgi:hypothetical protein